MNEIYSNGFNQKLAQIIMACTASGIKDLVIKSKKNSCIWLTIDQRLSIVDENIMLASVVQKAANKIIQMMKILSLFPAEFNS